MRKCKNCDRLCNYFFCSQKCDVEYKTQIRKQKYLENPKYCKKCLNILSYEKRGNMFCNSACSASYNSKGRKLSDQSKKNISNGVLTSPKYHSMVESARMRMYDKKIHCCRPVEKILWICPICQKEMNISQYEASKKKFCSKQCYLIDCRGKKQYCTIYRPGPENKGGRNSKKGYYKGIWCDSTYELVWIIYNLDHDVLFERNKTPFIYTAADNTIHNYYPDFKIDEDHYVEIKNYLKPNDEYKIKQFPHFLTILFGKDLKIHFDYVYQKYGKNLVSLYDKVVPEVRNDLTTPAM